MEKAFMLLSQIITIGTTGCMFYCLFSEKEAGSSLTRRTKAMLVSGTIFYLLLPVHVNAILGKDWEQILLWMLLPILVTALVKMSHADKMLWKCGFGLVAVLVTGMLGRLDGVMGLTVLFLICVAGICRKQWEYPVAGVLGILLSYPTYLNWKHWLFDGSFAESGLEYTSIMRRGYSIGGLFSTYFHRNGDPGMGILLLGALLFLFYVTFVKGRKLFTGADRIWLAAAALLTVMTLRYFPWDFVQRLGSWALGLVTLIGTPTVFFPYAQIILCVLCVEKIERIARMEEAEEEEERKEAV